MNKITTGILAIIIGLVFTFTAGAENDITIIGNLSSVLSGNSKVARFAWARNVWDMQVFGDRIYLGYGSWANSSPSGATNCGPIPIVALDIKTGSFVTEQVYAHANGSGELTLRPNGAEDEQLWQFHVINGSLYTPGTDSRGTFGGTSTIEWELGNFYIRQSNGTWLKKRTIPGGIHVFDIAGFNDKLYVGIGRDSTVDGSFGIMCSEDGGNTWAAPAGDRPTSRIYTLINWKDTLYGFAARSGTRLRAHVTDETNTTTNNTNLGTLSSVTNTNDWIIRKYAIIGNTLAFITLHRGEGGTNDNWDAPGELFYTAGFPNANIPKAVFPEPGALPTDILVRDRYAYILTNIQKGNDNFTVIVYKTENFTQFEECIRFSYGTLARSFEEYEGFFYFGMGTLDGNAPSELAGTIIKVPIL